jgi:hypothetical protein
MEYVDVETPMFGPHVASASSGPSNGWVVQLVRTIGEGVIPDRCVAGSSPAPPTISNTLASC